MGGEARYRWASLHRELLHAFCGPCPAGMEACHWPVQDPNACTYANLSYRPAAENRGQARGAGLLQLKAKDRPLDADDVRWVVGARGRGLTNREVVAGLAAERGVAIAPATAWRIYKGYSHCEASGLPPRRHPSSLNKRSRATARRRAAGAPTAPLAVPVFDENDRLVRLERNA